MRPLLLIAASAGLLGGAAFIGGTTRDAESKLRLRLLDAESGQPVGGMVRVEDVESGQFVKIAGLLDRLRGFKVADACLGWHVVPVDGAELLLPRRRLKLEAVHGLETGQVQQELDLKAAAPEKLDVKLPFLIRPERLGLVAGNTHLHLRNMTRAESDEYLRTIPAADGLKVMFISYLERHLDDKSYITNGYPIGDLPDLSGSGVVFANGEEHRHNFEGFGQGYGHVMFLGIKQLVKPVSIGPGITKMGNDDLPLKPGIENARGQGGTVVWCHNTYGHENVSNMLAGRLDALNVFDGSRRDTYDDLYYRFLNIGLRLPLSTGTDWFLYDFSRVYVRLPGEVTTAAWLHALKRGEAVATNGPLLTLSVAGKTPGGVVSLNKPGRVRIEASATGRLDFEKLQLIKNSRVVQSEQSIPAEHRFYTRLTRDIEVDGPAWFAVRIETKKKNEFDQELFAHTSPVYVDLAGKRVFDVESAQALLKIVEGASADIRARGHFSGPAARDKLLTLYDRTAADLRERINRRGK